VPPRGEYWNYDEFRILHTDVFKTVRILSVDLHLSEAMKQNLSAEIS